MAARFGRGKWLIIPPFSWHCHGDCRAGHELRPHPSTRPWSAPASETDLDTDGTSRLHVGVGSPTLDLTTWATSSAPAPTAADRVSVDVSASDLTVLVPATWLVNVKATTQQTGEIRVNGCP